MTLTASTAALCSALVLPLSLVGCSGKQSEPTSLAVALPGDDEVLARVAGQEITAYDVSLALNSTFGSETGQAVNGAGRHNILESLIRSRAMATACGEELTPRERAELERRVQHHREQLLVDAYVAKHAAPAAITAQDVLDYYQSHAESFGETSIASYELLGAVAKGAHREGLSKAFSKGQSAGAKGAEGTGRADWVQWQQELKAAGYQVFYKQGDLVPGVLEPELTQVVGALKEGEVSSPTWVRGTLYLVRGKGQRKKAAKPLSEVREQIKRAIQISRVSDAVARAASLSMKQVQVERIPQAAGKTTGTK